ncbi:MAG: TetR/AcrR family transcriptional regulator [Chloroflexi bacterium AL-W]|nr:TetR/AcrR family transcriptional regulator [Chloroflexi bacterium AL-N1]NOK71440.1 TetR/AcrR family transcriptional regulator [Chloroflexi bacterium AL-N10]NOK78843.1 TetR/AcrR family transcriptional regulator [Chloroflexi bacterium AL-N5]NOK86261.1 TetR/AcrR family transcriptional regulator [Chloroflexi bacterium AL-W]NOK93165.1 TetR/AcrR family transcriptional regulator [Chloroflexi bacterium AL-N15]
MSFEKAFDHSEELFQVALEEFIVQGYELASINSILKAAQMSKGQFYYHFKNKEALYLALIDILIAKKRTFLAEVMQPDDFEQDLFLIFKTQIRYSMAFAREYPAINRFAESFIREKGTPIYDKAMATYNFEDDELIMRLIEQAFQKGEFREDLPLPFIKKTIGYLFTHVAEFADLHHVDEFEDTLQHLITFMKTGLAKPD